MSFVFLSFCPSFFLSFSYFLSFFPSFLPFIHPFFQPSLPPSFPLSLPPSHVLFLKTFVFDCRICLCHGGQAIDLACFKTDVNIWNILGGFHPTSQPNKKRANILSSFVKRDVVYTAHEAQMTSDHMVPETGLTGLTGSRRSLPGLSRHVY